MELKHFKYWCYKVLPLVYDESLSYYEILCKVVKYINSLIDNDKDQGDDIQSLQQAVKELQEWTGSEDQIVSLIRQYLAGMIYVGISDAGYIVYYIPDSWSAIDFGTTGLDVSNDELSGNGHVANYDYGHLVLSMNIGD